MIILPANTLSTGGYDVANSCRFDRASNPHMTKTQSDGDRDKWTFSCWFKLGATYGTIRYILTSKIDGSNYVTIEMDAADKLRFGVLIAGSYDSFKKSNRVFYDVSAWHHLVCVYDSENGTAGHRQRVYINGVEETSWASDTTTTQNQDSAMNYSSADVRVGNLDGESSWWDGYLAEVCLVDGSALAPTSFGEFDEDSPDIWKPIDVSGLSFGTNGFYLDFEDSSNLGNDANGGTDLTEANITATDQATDTPTNNFATWNPIWRWALDNDTQYTEGNVNAGFATASDRGFAVSTMAVSAGKFYWEVKIPTTGRMYTGVADANVIAGYSGGPWDQTGTGASYSLTIRHSNGDIQTEGSTETAYAPDGADDDIIMWALDMDNNRVWHGINGTWSDSGDPTSGATGTGDLTTQVSTQIHLTQSDFIFPVVADPSTAGGSVSQANFGGCPGFAISSGNADANGYGNFEYAPPSGFLALCSKNLGSTGG